MKSRNTTSSTNYHPTSLLAGRGRARDESCSRIGGLGPRSIAERALLEGFWMSVSETQMNEFTYIEVVRASLLMPFAQRQATAYRPTPIYIIVDPRFPVSTPCYWGIARGSVTELTFKWKGFASSVLEPACSRCHRNEALKVVHLQDKQCFGTIAASNGSGHDWPLP